MADETPPSAGRQRGSIALVLTAFVAAILGFGYLSVEFSGAITVGELNDIAQERRDAAAPPAVPDGATDTRQMLAAIDAEFGEGTEAIERLQFRSGPSWTAWVVRGPGEGERGGTAIPGGLSGAPSGPGSTAFPGAPPRPGGPTTIGGGGVSPLPSSSRTVNGAAGDVPSELVSPEVPATSGTFDLDDVEALRNLAEVDGAARRSTDLADAVRGWAFVHRTADGIRVEITYETAETGAAVAVVVTDATGNVLEVRR